MTVIAEDSFQSQEPQEPKRISDLPASVGTLGEGVAVKTPFSPTFAHSRSIPLGNKFRFNNMLSPIGMKVYDANLIVIETFFANYVDGLMGLAPRDVVPKEGDFYRARGITLLFLRRIREMCANMLYEHLTSETDNHPFFTPQQIPLWVPVAGESFKCDCTINLTEYLTKMRQVHSDVSVSDLRPADYSAPIFMGAVATGNNNHYVVFCTPKKLLCHFLDVPNPDTEQAVEPGSEGPGTY